jgi:TPP-dependent pyruvate/acetoin dehydrogenase alpha subunit
MSYQQDDVLGFFKKMLELRACDNRLASLKYKDLVMNGFHPYIGEEAVGVGVCASLKPEDYVVSTHRPQGHALAKGASVRSIFCEMLARMGGPSNGLGGPMQWIDVDNNFFCGSIVGSGVSYATGFGLALQKWGKGNICACFFGDGASNTGSFHEGMNLAALWKLPVLYVCENNQYGEAMPVKDFVPVEHISARAASYGIKGISVDGMDVIAVAETAAEAIGEIRQGKGPVLIEAVTYRYRGHYLGDPENYRTKAEIEEWRKKDPVDRCRKLLIEHYGCSEQELRAIEEAIEKESDADQEWALAQPKPTLEYAVSNVLVPIAGRAA